MDHYIKMSLRPCLQNECQGDGHEGNFQDEKGPFWPLLN